MIYHLSRMRIFIYYKLYILTIRECIILTNRNEPHDRKCEKYRAYYSLFR
jgi:hypothetical protein